MCKDPQVSSGSAEPAPKDMSQNTLKDKLANAPMMIFADFTICCLESNRFSTTKSQYLALNLAMCDLEPVMKRKWTSLLTDWLKVLNEAVNLIAKSAQIHGENKESSICALSEVYHASLTEGKAVLEDKNIRDVIIKNSVKKELEAGIKKVCKFSAIVVLDPQWELCSFSSAEISAVVQ
ncbi:hypothetical protein BT96DRAFT_933076 [Gymnopus androsaceus JB14]|uniref:Uncharacterized protein n=1 Tax=Gymnopus androsaceus JB14 TaxID=1447944 RepID=A0A6A4IAR3_9AGAR|nr:hypothetical protein BT96DRAFT_933076 [Gymnopus androsaceus JB14]